MKLNEEKLFLLKRYAELGFHVFPCYHVRGVSCTCQEGDQCSHPGKHPKVGWTDPKNCASTYEDMVEMFSNEHYDANIAVNCTLSNLWVIDIDTKNDALGAESFQSLVINHGIPPETLQHNTPSGGFHIFFRQREDQKIGTTTNAYPGIDIRGVGGYVLLPPSVAPANNWANQFEKRESKEYVLREGGSTEIEMANKEWFDAFYGLTPRANDQYIDRTSINLKDLTEDSPVNPELTNWDELERCLSHIPSDCINIPNQSSRAFATYFKILGAIADACPGQKGLDLAIRWSAAVDMNGRTASNYHNSARVAYEFCRARNGNERQKNTVGGKVSSFRTVFKIAKDCGCPLNLNWWGQQVGQFRKVSMVCVEPKDLESPDIAITEFLRYKGDVIDLEVTEDLKIGQEKPPTMPELQLKGAVAYAYNYINSINYVQAPLLSVLPAIMTVAAATNRAFAMGNLRTVLHGINIAEAGAGKNAGIMGPTDLLNAIGQEDHILEDPRSAAAFYTKLASNPNTYWIVDEFADKLKPMFDERAGGYTKEIVPLILKAYSIGGGTLGGAQYKDEENNIDSVTNPHLNIFGAMVDNILPDIIKKEQIRSGFVRRFLLNWSPAGVKRDVAEIVAPNHGQLDRFIEWKEELMRETMLGDIASAMPAAHARSKVIELGIADKEHYRELVRVKDENLLKIPEEFTALYHSWEENLKKVAMVLCAGERALHPTRNLIMPEHFETASKIVTNSCDTWLYFFRHQIYENEIDKYAKKLVKELNKNKEDGVRVPDFRNRHKITRKFLYDDVIDMLVENGGVYMDKVITRTANNRRRETDYIWNINYLPEEIKKKLSDSSEPVKTHNKNHLRAIK
jgi:hypothetical protein